MLVKTKKKLDDRPKTLARSNVMLCSSPLRHRPPRSVLIGQNVEDLLLQLVGGHVISVLGCANEVVAHLLLLPPVRSVLGAVGLREGCSKGEVWVFTRRADKIRLKMSLIPS